MTINSMSKPENNTKDQFSNRITMSPVICHGKPYIQGMRYPVEMVLDLLSSGMTTDEILNDYRDLEKEDILAVLSYASTLNQGETYLTSPSMKLLLDAHLPLSIKLTLIKLGHV